MTDLHSQHTHGSDFDPTASELFIEPPKWPKVVGILSMIFGGISVTCGGLGMIAIPFLGPLMEGALNGAPPSPDLDPDAITLGIGGLSLVLNAVLLIAGFVLIGRKPSGRLLHLVYSLVFIPVAVAASWNALRIQTAKEAWAVEYPDNPTAQGVQQMLDAGIPMGAITAILTLVISLAWPLFCLIWFGLVKTKLHQMTGERDPHDPLMN